MLCIGFIGLGAMGQPMAHLLHQNGNSLLVQDTNASSLAAFVNAHKGVIEARTHADFGACDVVITMLPNSTIVNGVLISLAPHLKPGTCVIDMSSADPAKTRELGAFLARYNVHIIDAPVSGGVKKAVNGNLAIMVGGEISIYQQYKDLLSLLGTSITHVGPLGAGHALKALNNYVSAAALIATAEAIHVGAAFGIEREVIVDVIQASTGKNNTTENKAHQFMLSSAFNSGFSLALQAKDVGIAAALGRSLHLNMALAQKVSQITDDASVELGPKADHTELYKFVAKVKA